MIVIVAERDGILSGSGTPKISKVAELHAIRLFVSQSLGQGLIILRIVVQFIRSMGE